MPILGIAGTIAFGVFLYWLRSSWQFLYGCVEIVVALAIIFLTFYPQTNYLQLEEFSWSGHLLSHSVGMFAGIYVLVRGLDNTEKGLSARSRENWRRVFRIP
jgi:hypothetical protein